MGLEAREELALSDIPDPHKTFGVAGEEKATALGEGKMFQAVVSAGLVQRLALVAVRVLEVNERSGKAAEVNSLRIRTEGEAENLFTGTGPFWIELAVRSIPHFGSCPLAWVGSL